MKDIFLLKNYLILSTTSVCDLFSLHVKTLIALVTCPKHICHLLKAAGPTAKRKAQSEERQTSCVFGQKRANEETKDELQRNAHLSCSFIPGFARRPTL